MQKRRDARNCGNEKSGLVLAMCRFSVIFALNRATESTEISSTRHREATDMTESTDMENGRMAADNSKEKKRINRRSFLRSSAFLGVSGLAASLPGAGLAAMRREVSGGDKFMNFSFKPNGRFKILQLTDTHYIYGDARSERALKNVCQMLDAEKPDLVIHTGDVIFGKPAEEGLREILSPMSERKIPFAVALGNHDEEFGLSRKEVFDIVKSLPYNINSTVTGLTGQSNDIITLSAEGSTTPEWVFYLFDSGRISKVDGIKGYDWIHFDQIDWYRKHSQAFTAQNGGQPIRSMAFFHIPVPEFTYALHDNGRRIFKGNWGEEPSPANVNSGLYLSMKEMGDVKAIVCGHEHDNDYAMLWNGMYLMYGRFSGCDTVYNNLKPNGARVIELTQGSDGFQSWVRLYGGEITQNLTFPDSFKTY